MSQMSEEQILQQKLRTYQRDPLLYAKEVVGFKPSNQQKKGFEEVRKLVSAKIRVWEYNKLHHYKKPLYEPPTEEEFELAKKFGISIMSGHGTGKDAFVAIIMQWFMACFTPVKVP